MSYEDRKRQEEMVRWAREMRAKGRDVKVGQGAVKLDGIWRRWRDMEGEQNNNIGKECEQAGGRTDEVQGEV